MTTLLPGNLSQGIGLGYASKDHIHHATDRESRIKSSRAQSEPLKTENRQSSGDILPDIDEYGAELGKEAKFWKVYVEETDKWDGELVDGWNKSLDVILVFAALFSAISTAFLIESSSRLREDPADASAETLLIISRTLLAMSNNTRPPDLDSSLGNNQNNTAFQPSRAAILVNSLWYLSLSLSVATSLLAMLAKDWCHSFMAGRIGHPLLFAVGLCIDVWETNIGVAVPVIGISGIAMSFYTWSSITAVWVDDFPYTTIISRIFRSETAIAIYCRTIRLTILPFVRMFHSFVHKCYMKNNWFLRLDDPLWYLSGISGRWKRKLRSYIDAISSGHIQKGNPEQDVITSSALSWFIKHCEVPESVDIALQAIAGASMRLPRGPLTECKADQQISQRLVSWHLYKETEPHSKNVAIKLYLRALSFLTSKPPSPHGVSDDVSRNMGELEVMVWDLYYENENKVAALVADGQFEPKQHNLNALRIGATAVSQSLRLLKDNQDHSDFFKPILKPLQHHLQRSPTLHPAACLSLLNAAMLISACTVNNKSAADLAGVCIRILAEHNMSLGLSLDRHLAFPLIMCTLLQRKGPNQDQPNRRASSTRFHPYFRVLINQRLSNDRCLAQFVWSAMVSILSNPIEYNIDTNQDETGQFPAMLDRAKAVISYAWGWLSGDSSISKKSVPLRIVDRIEALQHLYTITQTDASEGEDFMFAIKSIIYAKSDQVDRCCWEFLSQIPFPRPSIKLIQCIEEYGIMPMLVQHLDNNSPSIRFIAAVQLWILCVLYLHPPFPSDTASEANDESNSFRLLALLRIYIPEGTNQTPQDTRHFLGRKIEALCNDNRWVKEHNTIFVHRVYECVLQSRECPASDSRWARIDRVLEKFPTNLRSLGTFTSLPMRRPRISEEVLSQDAMSTAEATSDAEHVMIPVTHGTAAAVGSPTEVPQNISPD